MEIPAVLLVHDKYGRSRGGISSINQQLAEILRKQVPDIPVFCTALEATEEDKQDAKHDGVELLLPKLDPGDPRTDPSLTWLTFDHRVKYPHLPSKIRSIVGHTDVTSRAAVRIKQARYPDADVILFTHDIPEDTEYYKGDEEAMGIGKKEDSILEDAQEADVVFSLGNKIFDHFANQFRAIPASKRPQHFKFVPKSSKIFEDAVAEYQDTETMVVLSIGRVKDDETLKGYDLAAEALSIVAEKRKVKWRVRGVDKEDFQVSKAILRHSKSANLQITLLPHGTQKDICRDMMQAHLILMPSRAEPFGIVGLETIAAGVPVLISSECGLADFVLEHVDELHHSIVDMRASDDAACAKHWAHSTEKVLKHCRTEFETAARGKRKLLSTRYWEESHQQFIKACTGAGPTKAFEARSGDSLQGHDKKADEGSDQTPRRSETEMDWKETPGQGPTPIYGVRPESAGGPPLLPVVVEILAQVMPTVETPDDMLNYASALETLSTIDADTTLPNIMLKQVKPSTRNVSDLLKVVKAVEKLERFKGTKVAFVEKGSLVFYLQCTDLDGLGELWFMYRRGELDSLLYSSLVSEETLQLLRAKSVSVKTAVSIENFRNALDYLLSASAGKGQTLQGLPQEYPLYRPRTHARRYLLDVLHIDRQRLLSVHGDRHDQEVSVAQTEDSKDAFTTKLNKLHVTTDTGAEESPEDIEVQGISSVLSLSGTSVVPDNQNTDEEPADTEMPKVLSELASLDIRELEQLMGQPRKRSSSIGSESSGYKTGTPGSGPSRPHSPTGERDIQVRLESLLAELNTPAVMGDKTQQFLLNFEIGEVYRKEMHNFKAALHHYQKMLECLQPDSQVPFLTAFENMKQALAYSRLGLTFDKLGLHQEATRDHENALAIYKDIGFEDAICVGYKNLASSLALSGQVSDAKTSYEAALAVAMETVNKTEQMDIYCKLGDLHRLQLHEPQVSHKYYTEMLALARDLGGKGSKRQAYNRLGLACVDMQDYEAALEWHQKCLKMSQEDGDKTEQITAHVNIGNGHAQLGNVSKATFHYNTVLHIAQQAGDQRGQMEVYLYMGEMHREQLHSPQTSIQYYKQALALGRQLMDTGVEGEAYYRLGLLHSDIGDHQAAMEWFNKYLEMPLQPESQQERMNVYFRMGEIHRGQLHSPKTSVQYYEQYLELARQMKDRHEEGLAYNRLGMAHFEIGEYDAALEWYQKYLEIKQNDGDRKAQMMAHKNVAKCYMKLGELGLARSQYQSAMTIANETGNKQEKKNIAKKLSKLR